MKKITGYVPKSVTDVICSFHFGLLCVFYPPTPHFLPPPPLTVQKTKIKKKKTHEDIIILHKCTKNYDHDVWFLRRTDGQMESLTEKVTYGGGRLT